MATGSGDRTVILWDVADPAHPRRLGNPLEGHTDAVWSVAFTGDGQTMATGSGDRTVILWDVADPARPRRLGNPLEGHTDAVWSVAFNEDGGTLVTGSTDGSVILWSMHGLLDLRQHTVDLACQRAGRGLSRDEWNRYIFEVPYRQTCY
jgi:WD40 repeat protein